MLRTLCFVVVLLIGASAWAQAPDPVAAPSAAEQPEGKPVAAPPTASAPAPVEAAAGWWERPGWWIAIPTWLLALAALALALYTARLWKATTSLLDENAGTAKKELRAYVALDEIFFTETEDSAAGEHKLRIRNYGQTPAYGMSIWCERASHLPQEGVKPFYDSPLVDGQLLHPVQAYTIGLAAAPLYRIGKPGFFTYGRIIYHDVYRQWWVTKFCFRYEGDGSFVPHGDYNDEEGPFEKRPA
ncbi:MAG TPA: hypothetical protein VED01_01065 [Burkholderiales bacterium]|nr:hypothetical protein [Burkholderiales bacterium]